MYSSLLQSAEEVRTAFMRWLQEEACQPHRDIPLTHHLMVPLLLPEGAVGVGWVFVAGWDAVTYLLVPVCQGPSQSCAGLLLSPDPSVRALTRCSASSASVTLESALWLT